MGIDNNKCPICNSSAYSQTNYDSFSVFWNCPVCGRFEISYNSFTTIRPRLASYLYYHQFLDSDTEYRYHTTLPKEQCDQYRKAFEDGDNRRGRPVHMDATLVDSWYPKTFSERVDFIVLQLFSLTKHVGQWLEIDRNELFSLLFVDRIEITDYQKNIDRDNDNCTQEAAFMLDFLQEESVIQCDPPLIFIGEKTVLRLAPKGYSRVDMLQKSSSSGRNTLVAMKFGDDTIQLRDAIRQGITRAGYHAVFIDEVQHNEFITPELLKYIRDSKFVVVDLTHQNNGAYFEEGYAMGFGKPVIQLCKDGTKLHFDIAQKNTIFWKTEEEIPETLENRIRATIE